MHLKWFKGKAVPDVMQQIRQELGPDALILHTKPARPWGPLRMVGGGSSVEILAAVDDRPDPPSAPAATATAPAAAPADAVAAEVATLRHLLVQFGGGRLLAPALGPVYERLVAGGVDASVALRILGELSPAAPAGGLDAGLPAAWIGDALARLVRTSEPAAAPAAARVALVGPAGAGKTTTVAKLAARAQIGGGRTSILNLDGSGFSSPGPLETLASILDVPYAAAITPEALACAMRQGPPSGLSLIDTPGLGRGDAAGLSRLGDLLQSVRADEVHLVLPATSKTADALAAVRAWSPLGITHLLFTRLDETASCGSVLTVAVETGIPLSYIGTGREIPGDLAPADAHDIVHRTLQQGARHA